MMESVMSVIGGVMRCVVKSVMCVIGSVMGRRGIRNWASCRRVRRQRRRKGMGGSGGVGEVDGEWRLIGRL
jgi:hypothetical protein